MLKKMLKLLQENNSSCIILKQNEIYYQSNFIGVKPLLHFMEICGEDNTPDDLILIDKVIGKAALLLAVKLGFRKIYTPLASHSAVETAEQKGVQLFAVETVPYIVNREKTGMCPLEQSVMHTEDPEEAHKNIRAAIAILMAQKPMSS